MGRTAALCVLNRWVQGPYASAPEGGADSETGRGLSLWQDRDGMGAALPWRQQWQRRADVVRDRRPKVWSGLGSYTERDESEGGNTDKQAAIKVVFFPL